MTKFEGLSKGIFWVGLSNLVSKGMFFISSIIAARILYPEDFGIISMATTFSGFIDVFNKLGIEAFVMSRKNITKAEINSVYLINILIRLVSAILLIIAGPFVATAYKTPDVQVILIFSGISFFISAFSSIPRATLLIDLKFNVVSKIEMFQNFINSSLIIIMALSGFKYLSFVIPMLLTNLLMNFVYFKITKWQITKELNKNTLLEVFKYSRSFLPKTMLSYLVYNSDYIFVGSLLGSKLLGFYFFGFDKAVIVIGIFLNIINRTFFPVFAKVQSDPEELKKVFFLLIQKTTLVLYPIIFIQLILARELINFLYGAKWDNSILTFQLILAYTFGRVVATNIHILFDAVNMPHQNLRHFIIITPFCVSALLVGTLIGGVAGVSLAAFLVHSFAVILLYIRACKVFNWSFSEFFKTTSKSLIPIIIQLPIIIPLKLLMNYYNMPNLVVLAVISSLIMFLYVIFTKFLLKDIYANIVSDVWQKRTA